MLNEVGDGSYDYHALNCRQDMQICDACNYNLFLPLKCFSCGKSNKPFLGENWGALLIAGEGDPESSCAEKEGLVFQRDIKAIKNVIKSRAVRIRDENLIKILPGGTETIHSGLQSLAKDKGVQNIFVYFSCHGRDGNKRRTQETDEYYSFAIGRKNLLTVSEFSQELEKMEHIDTFVIILDRCYAPNIPLKKGNLIQMNSCGPQETSKFNVESIESKSKFTEYFVNALEGLSCQKDKDSSCEICRSSRVNANDYLSVSSLFDYVKKHLATEQSPQTPTLYIGVTQQRFAYSISSDSELEIKSLEDKLESFQF